MIQQRFYFETTPVVFNRNKITIYEHQAKSCILLCILNQNNIVYRYPNLVKDFKPLHAHELWVADITFIAVKDNRFAYLYLITDGYSRKIVGFHVSDNPDFQPLSLGILVLFIIFGNLQKIHNMQKLSLLLILSLSSLFGFSQKRYKVTYEQLKEFEGLYEYYNHT